MPKKTKVSKPDEHEGADICSGCGVVFPYGTLLDIDEVEFDLLCPDCIRKQLKERVHLIDVLKNMYACYRTFSRTVPRNKQQWTSIDDDMLVVAEQVLRRVGA